MVQKPRSPQSRGSASPPEEYFDQTIEVCQPYSERTLARDDARAIATNVLGFMQALREWVHEDRMQCLSLKKTRR
jgi:hypothetical protein